MPEPRTPPTASMSQPVVVIVPSWTMRARVAATATAMPSADSRFPWFAVGGAFIRWRPMTKHVAASSRMSVMPSSNAYDGEARCNVTER